MGVNTDRVGFLVIGVVNDEAITFEVEAERLAAEIGVATVSGRTKSSAKIKFILVKKSELERKGGIIELFDGIDGA